MTIPARPKAGLYVDDSNLYKRGKASGWMTDYHKLYKWVAVLNKIVHARMYIGRPTHEPARTINAALEKYFENIGYEITSKDLKKLKNESSKSGFRNKCNFDVEMHDEIMKDLDDLDIVYICSGDSDFIRTKNNIVGKQKHVKFVAYKNNCAWEIRIGSWFISLDSIRNQVERIKHENGPITEKPGTLPGEVS